MLTAVLSLLAAAATPVATVDTRAPSEIVEAAPAGDWAAIAPHDLLVMDLAPDRDGKPRRVVIQLMPPPFSQGWIGNIRTLAAAHWWDGTSVNRVQDNYVVQWGDAAAEDKVRAKAMPFKLEVMTAADYTADTNDAERPGTESILGLDAQGMRTETYDVTIHSARYWGVPGAYGFEGFWDGWPTGMSDRGKGGRRVRRIWPVHCYGTVGVGRDLPPDTGSGAELYAVIGQAPRQLDRNIAVVGRVIEGIEHLSSLPRGTGPLGFYQSAAERVPIVSVRIGDEVPGLPRYEYLSTESQSFARYVDARANRRDAFFVVPAGGADICNVPVPVRRVPG